MMNSTAPMRSIEGMKIERISSATDSATSGMPMVCVRRFNRVLMALLVLRDPVEPRGIKKHDVSCMMDRVTLCYMLRGSDASVVDFL